MRFLFRVAFWLSVVVVLLPTSPSKQASQAPQLSSTEAMSAASAAVADMRQFCARQPDACAVGSQALTAFGHKAQAGAKMLYEFLSDQLGTDEAARGKGAPETTGSTAGATPSQNTLTPADLAPVWRGPPPRREAEPRREAQTRRPA